MEGLAAEPTAPLLEVVAEDTEHDMTMFFHPREGVFSLRLGESRILIEPGSIAPLAKWLDGMNFSIVLGIMVLLRRGLGRTRRHAAAEPAKVSTHRMAGRLFAFKNR